MHIPPLRRKDPLMPKIDITTCFPILVVNFYELMRPHSRWGE